MVKLSTKNNKQELVITLTQLNVEIECNYSHFFSIIKHIYDNYPMIWAVLYWQWFLLLVEHSMNSCYS